VENIIQFFLDNPNITSERAKNYFSINGNVNYDLLVELITLPTDVLEDFIGINNNLEDFNSNLQAPLFDPLNSPWFKKAREYANQLEEWSSNLGPKAKEKANELIDKTFASVLKAVAYAIYPFVGSLNEFEKQNQFQINGNNAVAILLYEFATGTGADERVFPLDSDIAQKLVEGDRLTAIKNDFFSRLTEANLSYEQFVSNGNTIDGGYAFSPDHTTIVGSINAHINANLVQFFIGGTSNKYSPTNQPGWIKVTITNETSRYSFLSHQGSNYPRDGSGNNRPLSTIKQEFTFLLKIN